MTVAVVVPAYNEEGYVGDVIDGLVDFVDRAYVVDDGSTDDTWAEIRRHASARNEDHDGHFEDLVVPIRHDENRGVGGAIKTGYQRAREESIDATAVLGGDDQMDPAELTRYLDPIADGVADYAKGNRFSRSEDWDAMPRFRLVGNVALSYLTKIASGYWETMDSQNGYTAISLRALEEADIEGMYEYYGYCNDLLVRLNVAGMRVADVPRSSEYAYTDGWKSHIDYKEYVPRVAAMLFGSFCWRLEHKYLLTSYNPLAPLYGIGMATLGAGSIGTLSSLLGRGRDGPGTWFLTTVVGALTFLYAATLDRADNQHLELQTAPETDDVALESSDGTPAGHDASVESPDTPSETDHASPTSPAAVSETGDVTTGPPDATSETDGGVTERNDVDPDRDGGPSKPADATGSRDDERPANRTADPASIASTPPWLTDASRTASGDGARNLGRETNADARESSQ